VLVGGNDAATIVQHHLKQVLFGELRCWRGLRDNNAPIMPRVDFASLKLRNLDLPLWRVNHRVWMQASPSAESPAIFDCAAPWAEYRDQLAREINRRSCHRLRAK
jgi:hypothetical protein